MSHGDGSARPEALTVGIDARLTSRGLGISRYITELAAALALRTDIARVVWFGPEETRPREPKVVAVPRRFARMPLETRTGSRAIVQSGIDVMHFAANTSWRSPALPTVVTVHDLIFLADRGRTIRQRVGRTYWSFALQTSLQAADRVVAVSDHTADELVGRGLAPRAAIAVIHHGVTRSPPARRAVEPYVVAFGGADPRKNVALVLRAYRDAAQDGCELDLVLLAGAGLSRKDRALAERLPGVRVVGYLSEPELRATLAGATALVHASTAEGFGLPVLEAMAVRTAVISGLCATTAEITGDDFLRIDPCAAQESVSRHLRDLAAAPQIADSYAARGYERAQDFSWDRSAARHAEVYRAALDQHRSGRRPPPTRRGRTRARDARGSFPR